MKYRYREQHEMKDSGVEWLGMIPKEWEVSKIGQYFQVRSEKVSDTEYPALSVSKNGIVPQMESVAKTDNNDNRKKVCINDFVINSRADRKGSCGVSKLNGSVSLIAHVLKISEELEPNYIHYLFRNYYFSEEFYRWGTGIVDDLWSTNIERMKKINIPFFFKENQQKIADFLDKKCEEFDSVIAKKEMLINKLEEAKKSLISEVVTGKVKVIQKENGEYGIIKREAHEMKDSGVEWLGMIPKEWEVSRLKYHAIVMGGFAFSSNDFEEDGIQIIKISNLYMNELQLDRQPNYISKNSLDKFKNYIVTEGDILISLTGTLGKRDYGYAIFIKIKDIFLLNQRVGKITCKNTLFKEYLITLLHSEEYLNQLYSYPSGTKQANLSNEDVLNPILPIPSKKEQGLLIRYIAVKMNEIEKVNKKLSLQIEKLKLAKQSLISEAVTGKIEIL